MKRRDMHRQFTKEVYKLIPMEKWSNWPVIKQKLQAKYRFHFQNGNFKKS